MKQREYSFFCVVFSPCRRRRGWFSSLLWKETVNDREIGYAKCGACCENTGDSTPPGDYY